MLLIHVIIRKMGFEPMNHLGQGPKPCAFDQSWQLPQDSFTYTQIYLLLIKKVMQKKLFGTNGIRGIFGEDLTLDLLHDITLAIATYFDHGTILVGYDCRLSSKLISKIICSTLNYCNLNCKLACMVPTPCLQLAIKKMEYDGGIMITASHNPPQYNGLKIISEDGIEISEQTQLVIENIYFNRKWKNIKKFGNTKVENNVIQTYIEDIESNINMKNIIPKKFVVVLDPGNGVQSLTAPKICKDLGCDVTIINKRIDGLFPGRGSEPTVDNLEQLSSTVIKRNADIGIAFDGDGDRSIFCTNDGKIINGSESALMLADYILKKRPNSTVITCINTPSNIDKIVSKRQSTLIRTRVGSVYVSRTMKSTNAIIGFEENGGFMFKPHLEVRDGAMTMALMLDMLSCSQQTLSQKLSKLPNSFVDKTKICCPNSLGTKIISTLKDTHNNFDDTDGIKISLDSKTWIMVRQSGTEPLLRIYAESDNKEKLDKIVSHYVNKIQNLADNIFKPKTKTSHMQKDQIGDMDG